MRTGHGLSRVTHDVTLPITMRAMPRRPCVLIAPGGNASATTSTRVPEPRKFERGADDVVRIPGTHVERMVHVHDGHAETARPGAGVPEDGIRGG